MFFAKYTSYRDISIRMFGEEHSDHIFVTSQLKRLAREKRVGSWLQYNELMVNCS